jgi:hypothetical protein
LILRKLILIFDQDRLATTTRERSQVVGYAVVGYDVATRIAAVVNVVARWLRERDDANRRRVGRDDDCQCN